MHTRTSSTPTMQRGPTLHHQHHVAAREQTAQMFYAGHRHRSTPVATRIAPGMAELQHRHVCSACAHACWLTPFPRAASDGRHCVVLSMSRYIDRRPPLARSLSPPGAHMRGVEHERRAKTSSTPFGPTSINVLSLCVYIDWWCLCANGLAVLAAMMAAHSVGVASAKCCFVRFVVVCWLSAGARVQKGQAYRPFFKHSF